MISKKDAYILEQLVLYHGDCKDVNVSCIYCPITRYKDKAICLYSFVFERANDLLNRYKIDKAIEDMLDS